MKFSSELFNWSLTFMRRIGYFDQPRLVLLYLLSPISLSLMAYYRTYVIRNDFDEVIVNLFKISGSTMTIGRAFIVMCKSKKFLNFFESVDEWYQELHVRFAGGSSLFLFIYYLLTFLHFQREGDDVTLKKAHEYTKKIKKTSKTVLILTGITIFYVMFVQLLSTAGVGYKKLILDVAFPGVDFYESPLWEMMSILQGLWTAPIVIVSYVSYLCLTLIAIAFGIFLMKNLQSKLEGMNEMTDEEALNCIKKCVKDHVMIIKYHRDLEVLFSVNSFADVCIFAVIPCVIIIISTMDHDMSMLIGDIQLSIMVMISTFLVFWSANIAKAAYNCNWENRNKEFRKYIPLIIIASQRPLQLTAGGLKPINMEFFLTMVRCTYSLFTVLFTMKTEGDS
ncbi:odorant receptor 49b isoform X2 [Bactrocera dorsalis]|uniref:Odorant receptor n=1 Tax=Bactrocera dorsalis TaxID=27457 RepID=A0ABM3JWP4_BACDO|nr:odorant receptor 49b isoform X2 [Bactrocera dorsalis]